VTAPQIRTVCQQSGEVLTVTIPLRELEDLRADLAKSTAERDDARAEVDNLTSELITANKNAANASVSRGMYQVERDDYRERADEYRDMHAEALTRIQELEAELAQVKSDAQWERS
jgi:uncharacterized coiled-coil DUF342 family protein